MTTCPVAAENTKDNFLLKNDLFVSFQRGILQVRWTKGKLLVSNFFMILCAKIIQMGLFLTKLFKKE